MTIYVEFHFVKIKFHFKKTLFIPGFRKNLREFATIVRDHK